VVSFDDVALKRSPILGYNHNIRYRGRVYHVQTEDSGVDNPHVFTHVFHEGVIITTRKLNYDTQSSIDAVKGLMQVQHKSLLKELRGGTFDEKIVAYLGPHPEEAGPSPVTAAEPAAPAARAAPPLANEALPPDAQAPTVPLPPAADAVVRLSTPGLPPIGELPDGIEGDVSAAFAAIQTLPTAAPGEAIPSATVSAIADADARSVPVEIRSVPPRPDTPLPPPIPTDIAASAGAYIQSGVVRREAPLVSSDEMARMIRQSEMAGAKPPGSIHDQPTAPVVRDPSQQRATRPRAQSVPPPIPESARRRPEAPAARPPARPGGPQATSSVVVSRPAVIVGAPPQVVGGSLGQSAHRPPAPAAQARARSAGAPGSPARSTRPRIATPGTGTTTGPPLRPRPRAAREERPTDSLFGQDLISERSLDEVILAYLSEDPDNE
jgi:hypothetical protein